MKRRAFTLIELLVVISIIALLVALLLPALQSARASGWSVQCLSNQRQMGIAFNSYANEFADYIPDFYIFASPGAPGGTWCQKLGRAGYVGTSSLHTSTFGPTIGERWPIFRCPAETVPSSGSLVTLSYWDYPYTRSSYVINWSVSGYSAGTPRKGFLEGPRFGTPVAYSDSDTPAALRPSEAPFVTDSEDQGAGWAMCYFSDNMNDEAAWSYYQGYTGYYHSFRHPGGGANMLYMDSHAATIQPHYRGGPLGWRLLWNFPP
jgi:prepilin-type N-terminal cleavage/methylation domain-containing protein/prepilin-type processing-associated H-X9-DG protein